MKRNYIFGLPPTSLNLISLGGSFLLVCLGIRIIRATDLALSVANTQLITSSSANRLQKLADRLEAQAELIKQKDKAYQELQQTLSDFQYQRINSAQVQRKVKEVEKLPQPDDIDSVKVELSETKEELLQITE